MKNSKLLLFFSLLIIISCDYNKKKNSKDIVINESRNKFENKLNFPILKEKSKIAKEYCQSNELNTDYYFLIDLKRHSGLKRFYVWDFKKDTITYSFLVSHGCANNPWGEDISKDNPVISNQDGSHASSIGKFIIGKRGHSNWGIHVNYLLHGKDSTNSNALQRQIVLHSWEAISDQETYPLGTPEGWGCPAVSNSSMYVMDKMLKKSNENVLLWVIK